MLRPTLPQDRTCGSRRQAARVYGGSVARGVNPGDLERKLRLFAANQRGERPADIAVSDERELQESIVATRASQASALQVLTSWPHFDQNSIFSIRELSPIVVRRSCVPDPTGGRAT